MQMRASLVTATIFDKAHKPLYSIQLNGATTRRSKWSQCCKTVQKIFHNISKRYWQELKWFFPRTNNIQSNNNAMKSLFLYQKPTLTCRVKQGKAMLFLTGQNWSVDDLVTHSLSHILLHSQVPQLPKSGLGNLTNYWKASLLHIFILITFYTEKKLSTLRKKLSTLFTFLGKCSPLSRHSFPCPVTHISDEQTFLLTFLRSSSKSCFMARISDQRKYFFCKLFLLKLCER